MAFRRVQTLNTKHSRHYCLNTDNLNKTNKTIIRDGLVADILNLCNSMPLGAAWAYYMLGKSSRTG